MNRKITQVENLGKLYRIPQAAQRRNGLRYQQSQPLNVLDSLLKRFQKSVHEESLWALKGITFDVNYGEVIGIIGSNGAGKSTLLKILSRITEPTEGRAILYGRVGSILEVGTGFHPELTGRENINLSGTIMGMKRAEVSRKFDEIVAFSEVEDFIDMPVKRYSSGMYVRLAFAVAAHMDPEILIVDEVLAVGDASFQKKCLGKMGNVANEGRTVLFVSHNLAAVSNLCNRVVCLAKGKVINIAETKEGISQYLKTLDGDSDGSKTLNTADRTGSGPLQFTSFHCESLSGEPMKHMISGEGVRLVLGYTCSQEFEKIHIEEVSIVVYGSDGSRLANLSSLYFDTDLSVGIPSEGQFICTLPKLPLRSGRYTVALYCKANGQVSDWIRSSTSFDVEDGDYFQTGRITTAYTGSFFIEHTWGVRNAEGAHV
jgi:homopolymeric O-antigen transport system ATP-binding protein